MRIPAVAIAVAFSGGFCFAGGHLSHGVLGISFPCIFTSDMFDVFCSDRPLFGRQRFFSLLDGLELWALGSSCGASRPLAAEHVLRRIRRAIEFEDSAAVVGYLRSEPPRRLRGHWAGDELSAWKPRRG